MRLGRRCGRDGISLGGVLSRTAWHASGDLPPRYRLKAPPSREEREKGGAPAHTLWLWHSRFSPSRKERDRMGHPHHVCDFVRPMAEVHPELRPAPGGRGVRRYLSITLVKPTSPPVLSSLSFPNRGPFCCT